MHTDINDLLINITLDSAQIDGAFLLCKVMFTIMGSRIESLSQSHIAESTYQFPFPFQFQFQFFDCH